jgi:hypothetical protein
MNTMQAAADDRAHREAFALAIVQGYIAKNGMPGEPDMFVQDVWALADRIIAARLAPKKQP